MSRRRVRLASLAGAIVEGAERGLYKEATEIISDSLPLVPVDTGTLKGSARVLEPEHVAGHIEVRAGYGYGEEPNPTTGQPAAGYALYVHEDTTKHHDPPTQDHFLSRPALEHKATIGATVSIEIRKSLRSRGAEVA